MRWLYPENAWCLAIVGAIVVLAAVGLRRSLRMRRNVYGIHGGWRPCLKFAMRVTAAALVGLAILGPSWGEHEFESPPIPGRDVLFLLDVSRSMLAQDAAPNRLEAAREGVSRLAKHVEALGGHRLGLVLFADRAAVLCPLTTDYLHFHQALAEASLDVLRLKREPSGVVDGTQLSLALAKGRQALGKAPGSDQNRCDFILVSDGGDESVDSMAGELDFLASRGVRVFTLGIGDEARSSPIPIDLGNGRREYLTHDGKQVATRLEDAPLRQIANRTGATYAKLQAGNQALERIATDIEYADRKADSSRKTFKEYVLRFEWFILPAVLLLMIEQMIRSRCSDKMGNMNKTGGSRINWLRRVVPLRTKVQLGHERHHAGVL